MQPLSISPIRLLCVSVVQHLLGSSHLSFLGFTLPSPSDLLALRGRTTPSPSAACASSTTAPSPSSLRMLINFIFNNLLLLHLHHEFAVLLPFTTYKKRASPKASPSWGREATTGRGQPSSARTSRSARSRPSRQPRWRGRAPSGDGGYRRQHCDARRDRP